MIKIAKRPNKIKTYNKKYSLVMSPFYRLTSQYILCQLLSISDAELLSLLEKKIINIIVFLMKMDVG